MQFRNHLQDFLPQLRPQGPPQPQVEADRVNRMEPPVVVEGTSQRRLRGGTHQHAADQPLQTVGTGTHSLTQLCRKDMMIKNIRKHRRQLQKDKQLVEADWDFLPLTYFLPSEYIMFAEDFRRKGGLWIMKPTSRCQGQGIFIIDKLAQVAPFRQKVLPSQVSTPQNLKPVLPPHKQKKEEEKKI